MGKVFLFAHQRRCDKISYMKKNLLASILFLILGMASFTKSAEATAKNEQKNKPGRTQYFAGDVNKWESAQWIGYTQDKRTSSHAERNIHPGRLEKPITGRVHVSPLLRKTFQTKQTIRSAHVKLCGLGLHELYVNGHRVGDNVLSPAPTTYDHQAFYNIYDVTEYLNQGQNVLGIWLGNGFYGQNIAFAVPELQYGKPRAKLLLTIEYEDGSITEIATDKSWKGTQSPIVFDNLYAGETYDARLELTGWSKSGFNDKAWFPVEMMEAPTHKVVKQELEPIQKIRKVNPIAIWQVAKDEWILDVGENLAGWIEISLDEPRGTAIEMRFAELLKPGGKAIDVATTGVNATGCEQKDIYICKGGGESWEPRFTYHGFRYVQIKGLTKEPNLEDFTAWFIRTNLQRIGSFECSNTLINTYYEVSLRTIEGNLHGLLSDCPHRERCAWLGDMHVSAEAISMNYASNKLWQKHVADFETVLGAARTVAQHYPEGEIPPKDLRAPSNIACGKRLCGQARPDWGMAMVLVPWYNWLYYGDEETVRSAWEMMVDYMEFLDEEEVKDGLIKEGYSYGDWCPPGGNKEMDTPPQLTASALYYQSNKLMSHMAKLLGKQQQSKKYAKLASQTKKAFNGKFFDSSGADYGSQTANSMALHYGLVPEGKEMAVATSLNRLIQENNGYSTGIMGHRQLYTVLNDRGYAATTQKLWNSTEYPNLGYMTEEHGLTTWPENVDDWTKDGKYTTRSFNHPMQSAFAVSFHESIGGIRPDPKHPGFTHFVLKPCFLPGLEWAKAEHDSPKGLILSSWERKGDVVIWNVKVPDVAFASVVLQSVEKVLLNGKQIDAKDIKLSGGDWKLEIWEE